jgi:hypothetical protein
MSIDQPARPSSAPVGAIIVLAVVVFLYAGMMANLGEMQNPNTDAMGRGMASGFALMFVLAEWFFLAILLLVGGIKGEMPIWSALTALILLPLSGFAAINTLTLLDHEASLAYQLVRECWRQPSPSMPSGRVCQRCTGCCRRCRPALLRGPRSSRSCRCCTHFRPTPTEPPRRRPACAGMGPLFARP